jgi:hypothetical protein
VIECTASCSCGQLRATATGDPVRISACHCLACKKRTGSAFSVQVRWPAEQVTVEGRSRMFRRIAESGNPADFHFCPECGATVHFSTVNLPGLIAIPLGAFEDPAVFTPTFSIWEEHKADWVEIVGAGMEHSD